MPNLLYWHRRCSGSEKEIDTLCFSPLWLKASRAILYMRQNKVASKSRAIFVNPRLWVGSVSMKSKCLRVIGFTLRFEAKILVIFEDILTITIHFFANNYKFSHSRCMLSNIGIT